MYMLIEKDGEYNERSSILIGIYDCLEYIFDKFGEFEFHEKTNFNSAFYTKVKDDGEVYGGHFNALYIHEVHLNHTNSDEESIFLD